MKQNPEELHSAIAPLSPGTRPAPSLSMRDLPEADRPRERLLEQGARVLSDAELLAVLLRTGRYGASALDLARELLAAHGGLSGLESVDPREIQRLGVGPAKAASLLAALEIGRRLAREQLPEELLTRPVEVVRYLQLRYGARDQEVMGALFLNLRNRLIGEREIYRGTIDRASVEPREVLKEALLRGASGFVVFHTHPSGDPSPSAEDYEFTRRLVQAAELLGLRMIDHLILGGPGRWASIRDRRPW